MKSSLKYLTDFNLYVYIYKENYYNKFLAKARSIPRRKNLDGSFKQSNPMEK